MRSCRRQFRLSTLLIVITGLATSVAFVDFGVIAATPFFVINIWSCIMGTGPDEMGGVFPYLFVLLVVVPFQVAKIVGIVLFLRWVGQKVGRLGTATLDPDPVTQSKT